MYGSLFRVNVSMMFLLLPCVCRVCAVHCSGLVFAFRLCSCGLVGGCVLVCVSVIIRCLVFMCVIVYGVYVGLLFVINA